MEFAPYERLCLTCQEDPGLAAAGRLLYCPDCEKLMWAAARQAVSDELTAMVMRWARWWGLGCATVGFCLGFLVGNHDWGG